MAIEIALIDYSNSILELGLKFSSEELSDDCFARTKSVGVSNVSEILYAVVDAITQAMDEHNLTISEREDY